MPCGFEGRGAWRDVVIFVFEAGGVFDGGVDVFEGDGEVDYVEVEVVDAPVLELLWADVISLTAEVALLEIAVIPSCRWARLFRHRGRSSRVC